MYSAVSLGCILLFILLRLQCAPSVWALCGSLYGRFLTIISLNIASCPFSTFSSSETPNDCGCCCSVAKPCLTLCNPMDCTSCPPHQASLSFTVSWGLLKLMSTESVTPSKHLIFCYPLFLLPSIFPSIRVFSSESALHIRWPNYWSVSISPSNEYSGLISFAAAAKSLQSCPTLCDPINGSPPGSPVPGILKARTLEWVAISFSNV